jgi:predicted nucleic acid-binding protein
MILIDTSVWVLFFQRGRRPFELEQVAPWDEIVTCLPVIQEVLQGFRDEKAFRVARESFFALPSIEAPLGPAIFEQAVDLYRAGRRAGLTVRSSVDCLIAACAIRNDAQLLHHDRDFTALAQVSALRERRI